MELASKTAVVTGAAGGIGLGIARACLDNGMRVVISDVDAARLAETAADLRASGGEVADQACDVRQLGDVQQLRDVALEAFGQVDLVCNNAGVGLVRPVLECTDGDWDLLFDVNVKGVINGIRTFAPLLVEQGSGHISATSSLSGLLADPGLVVYNGSKFAVVGLMESLALELRAESSVTCSVLCPGPVATDLMATSDKHLLDAGSRDQLSQPDADVLAGYLAAGMHPDEVGRFAINGIKDGDFWLVTHPDYTFSLMDPRYEAMKRRKLYVAPLEWAEHR